MKYLAVAALVAVGLTLVGTSAKAAGEVSCAALSQCGLGGMQSLSDEQGMQIRAKGVIVQTQVLIVYDPSPGVVSQTNNQGGNNNVVIVTNAKNNYVQQNTINGCNTLKIITKGGRGGKPA